ncbi:hypothetical protein AGR7C_Lc140187 [Agrobacterium deltaense Zutra 3/1]|uniref:Uncharacterized protein n=1 Tax=Agrobacterium deltaense Zutra 3/1 TaxID=1183427 RepID=A0A1S7RBW0_9HYPH|nr:hypothetical protein AGR7C_Lc140187 [Agrobacterium deltaense Zutra 3/1]
MQVGNKGALLSLRLLPVAKAQQIRGMDGDEKACAARRQKNMPAFLRHTARASRQRIKGRGAHGHDKIRIDKAQFCTQPPGAALHFPAVRAGMQPSFPTLLEFKMFYGVGHITLRTIYLGFLEAFLEQTACRADERPALQVFFIAGLFANEDHARPAVAVTKNQLGGVPVEVTSFAAFRLLM